VSRTDTNVTDEDLLREIAAGRVESLVQLFRRRRDTVYRFALHMTGAASSAEDITQDVFLTVMRDASRFDAERGAGQSWLLGIARNLVRRRLIQDRVWLPLEDVREGAKGTVLDHPAVTDVQTQRVISVRRAVRSLPVRYREVVLLCDLEELSYQDAAQALDIAVGTVRSRLHRGRALLAVKLRKETDGRRPAVALA
jgi:RNA polymerase sigma-70 factor (ECF subfamily)